jgi:DNA invertase Pin-like site-specific DNA recombinase
MTIYIYSRVSTLDQSGAGQTQTLKQKHPSALVVEETFTGTTTDRPQFQALLSKLIEGDTLVVREVSRLGRNSIEVLELAESLKARRIHLLIDNLGIDITTPSGEMIFTMMAGMAKMERELMLERQRIGIEKAKQEGKYTGRKALDPKLISMAKRLVGEGMSKPDVAKQLKMGLSTLYKYLAA